MRGLLQMLVQRRPQAGVVRQRFAKPQPGVGDALLHAGILALHIRLQPLAQVGPHLPQIAVKRLVVFQVVLNVVGFCRHLRIVFQVVDKLQRGAVKRLADLVRAVVADIVQQRVNRVRYHLRTLIAQPLGGQHHRLARVLGLQPVDNLVGNKVPRAFPLNQGNQAVDDGVQQHLVSVVFGHALQHHGAGFGEVDLVDGLMHRAFEQALNAPVVGEFEKTAHHLHQMQPDALGVVGLAEPGANHLCGLIAADQRHQRLGIQKLLLHELAEIVANPVFIARDDRRMARDKGNGHPAEKRDHRKPVRQRADHRRLGNGLDAAHPEGLRQEQGGDKGRGGNQQQRQRQQLGAFEFSYFFHGLRIEASEPKVQNW